MENFVLLHDYIEGVLPQESEQELFSLLKSSEELRIEFRELLSINSTLKNNRNVFPVNDGTKAAIFSAIDLEVPGNTPGYNQPIPGGLRFNKLFRKYSQNIITGLVSAAAACLLMYIIMSSNNGINNQDKQIFSSEVPVTKANPDHSGSERLTKITKNPQIRTIIKYVYIDTSKYSNNGSLTTIHQSDIAGSPILKPVYIMSHQTIALNKQYQQTDRNDLGNFIILNDGMSNSGLRHGISFEVKGSQYRMLPAPTVTPYQPPLFNNTSLAFLYSLDEHWTVGFDLRQENFFQKFNGYDKIGSLNTYEQQPNFTTFSAVARYKTGNYLGFVPFTQLLVGINENGVVPRISGGLEYILLKELSVMVSLEYSRMYFGYQNSKYESQKIGLNYGISYNF